MAVYFDSTRRVFSAKATAGPNKGLVVWKGVRLRLTAPTFKVNEAGRERVRRTRRKTPHAFVEGEVADTTSTATPSHRPVRYCPWYDDHFVIPDGSPTGLPVQSAEEAVLWVADGHPHVFARKPRRVAREPSQGR